MRKCGWGRIGRIGDERSGGRWLAARHDEHARSIGWGIYELRNGAMRRKKTTGKKNRGRCGKEKGGGRNMAVFKMVFACHRERKKAGTQSRRKEAEGAMTANALEVAWQVLGLADRL